jgi:hypothetical protein
MVYSSGVAKNRLSNETARRISESPRPRAGNNGIAAICRKETCGGRGLSLGSKALVRNVANNSKDV